jgi:hypothetical protein
LASAALPASHFRIERIVVKFGYNFRRSSF